MTKIFFRDAINDNWGEPKRTKGGIALAWLCAAIASVIVIAGVASGFYMVVGK